MHGGLILRGIEDLYLEMVSSSSEMWSIEPNFTDGHNEFTISSGSGSEKRNVVITMGRTLREAEVYNQVRQELLGVRCHSGIAPADSPSR